MEARYYVKSGDNVSCRLCPHNCDIIPGKSGICGVRKNEGGKLYSNNYGKVSSLHSDPIEKKPLYHFFPGRNILSVGSLGCNLKCRFCQNWQISQASKRDLLDLKTVDAEEIASLANAESGNIGIAYTYNEPIVWFEFMQDIAARVRSKHLKNVMVTNGYINPDPLKELVRSMDAFSVDLKAFSETFYQKLTGSGLQPVLDTLKTIRASGLHLEITNLVIPGQNDDLEDFTRMVDWIAGSLGENTVLHISRYYPNYKLQEPPTPASVLADFFKIARSKLQHVYIGNLRTGEGQHTFCPGCNTVVINRSGYQADITGLDHAGCCLNCQAEVINRDYLHLA